MIEGVGDQPITEISQPYKAFHKGPQLILAGLCFNCMAIIFWHGNPAQCSAALECEISNAMFNTLWLTLCAFYNLGTDSDFVNFMKTRNQALLGSRI